MSYASARLHKKRKRERPEIMNTLRGGEGVPAQTLSFVTAGGGSEGQRYVTL